MNIRLDLRQEVTRLLLERGKISYALLDENMRFKEFAPNFEPFFQTSPAVGQLATRTFEELIGLEEEVKKVLCGVLPEYNLEYLYRAKENEPPRYLSWRLFAIRQEILLLAEDVTPNAIIEQRVIQARNELYLLQGRLRQMNSRLRFESRYDVLTNLPNRRYLDDMLLRYVEFSRQRQTPLTFVMLDIDDFKQINDRYSHEEGDRALRLLADIFASVIRSSDFAARYGGDEFCILLPFADKFQARQLVERLMASVDIQNARSVVPFTISAGVAELRPDWEGANLFRAADAALHRAKQLGKNQFFLWDG